MPWRNKNDLRAFLTGLPYGICCAYAILLGQIVFGYNDAGATFGVSCYRKRNGFQLGHIQTFTGGEKIVAVAVKNESVIKVHAQFVHSPFAANFARNEHNHLQIARIQYSTLP